MRNFVFDGVLPLSKVLFKAPAFLAPKVRKAKLSTYLCPSAGTATPSSSAGAGTPSPPAGAGWPLPSLGPSRTPQSVWCVGQSKASWGRCTLNHRIWSSKGFSPSAKCREVVKPLSLLRSSAPACQQVLPARRSKGGDFVGRPDDFDLSDRLHHLHILQVPPSCGLCRMWLCRAGSQARTHTLSASGGGWLCWGFLVWPAEHGSCPKVRIVGSLHRSLPRTSATTPGGS
eukprot:4487338-Amphidinium_carterae.2